MAHGPTGATARASPARLIRIAFAAAALAAVALLAYLGRPGDDYRHSDFFQFWAAPRLLLEGGDPYDRADWADVYAREARAPVATPPLPGRHIYPLWSAVPLLPLGALPLDLAAALWVSAQVVAIALAVRALAGVFALRRRERVVLYGLTVGFQPVWLIAGGGNVTGLVLAAFVAAIAWHARHPVAAGAALALVSLKPHPLVLGAPALLLLAPRACGVRMLAAAAVVFSTLVAITLPFGVGWIPSWLDAAVARQLVPTGSNSTVWTIGRVLPGGAAVAVALAVGALAALAAWWARRAGPQERVAAAVAVSLFIAPHGWSYDQVLLLIPLAATLAASSRMAQHRQLALGSVALVFGVAPWLLYALAYQRGGEEWSALTPLAAFALLALASAASDDGRIPHVGGAPPGGGSRTAAAGH